jgi:hypothetical protein
LAKLRDHPHDRGGSLRLVKLDIVAALAGKQVLAMG